MKQGGGRFHTLVLVVYGSEKDTPRITSHGHCLLAIGNPREHTPLLYVYGFFHPLTPTHHPPLGGAHNFCLFTPAHERETKE